MLDRIAAIISSKDFSINESLLKTRFSEIAAVTVCSESSMGMVGLHCAKQTVVS
ncbi:hypothetical protein D3C81_2193050 [compost metagenome]